MQGIAMVLRVMLYVDGHEGVVGSDDDDEEKGFTAAAARPVRDSERSARRAPARIA